MHNLKVRKQISYPRKLPEPPLLKEMMVGPCQKVTMLRLQLNQALSECVFLLSNVKKQDHNK